MVQTGDSVPDVSVPLANGDIETFELSDRLDEAPLVLAFFPGAFTSVCSHEMTVFEDRLDEFATSGASVYGISVDTPFALNEFRDQLGLSFGMLSDTNRTMVDEWDVAMDFTELGVDRVAKRAVFVVDEDGTVVYEWVSDDPGIEPDYDAVLEAVESV